MINRRWPLQRVSLIFNSNQQVFVLTKNLIRVFNVADLENPAMFLGSN